MCAYQTLVKNAAQLCQVAANHERVVVGKAMGHVSTIANGYMVIDQGIIRFVGSQAEFEASEYAGAEYESVVDATGRVVMPGLVDAHTHPVFEGDRCHEFSMKLEGASYIDIHKAGGGIGFTVKHVREADDETLATHLEERIQRLLASGTTCMEAKTGYGLDEETELKMLRVINSVKTKPSTDMTMVSTFLGAHSVPKGSTQDEATETVIGTIPKLASVGGCDQIDVFLEKGVFDGPHTRRILEAGVQHGMAINFHGDELNYMAGAEMAADLKARAMSHCECVTPEGMAQMAKEEVVGVVLPTTSYILRIHPAPARQMIEAGVPLALASDFNPNAPCYSMPLTMHLGCIFLGISMAEALVASTINAAASIGRADTHGSLETGKQGDFIVLDASAPSWEHIIYRLGDNVVDSVYVKGRKVV
ncbi:imidazolonepropionase [Kipferlia bialata]|uniref:Probable imidazolonepropionase n=1 Tax=Kipferlia bialata TaxID=797122 RepID=A0A9K3D4V6_9EUKA|nr:imidazolonepropionase [Kipferlia bialata]|eukprot:g9829.t1